MKKLIIIVAILTLSCTSQREKRISLSESDLLIITERAFLEGYKTKMLNRDMDSAWVELSAHYSRIFDESF